MESNSHKNVYEALAAAQSEMDAAVKGSVNPAFKSRYADLADVVGACRSALNRHGLAFFHTMGREDGADFVDTVLAHGASDTQIACRVRLIVSKNDMQGMKSATTYAKRIGLESVTGIAPEDDDGNAAAASVEGRPDRIGSDQFVELQRLIEETGSDEARLLQYVKAGSVEEMTVAQFEAAAAALRKKIAQRGEAA